MSIKPTGVHIFFMLFDFSAAFETAVLVFETLITLGLIIFSIILLVLPFLLT